MFDMLVGVRWGDGPSSWAELERLLDGKPRHTRGGTVSAGPPPRPVAASPGRPERPPVAYAELPGAQHAFEVFRSVRGTHAIRAVARFLEVVYRRRAAER